MQTAEDSEHRAALDREETPYMASTLVLKAVTKPTVISMTTDPDQFMFVITEDRPLTCPAVQHLNGNIRSIRSSLWFRPAPRDVVI